MSLGFQIDDLQLITGIDIPVPVLGLTIRQPKMHEIAMIGENQYFIALQIFQITPKKLEISDKEVTNWDVFQQSLTQQVSDINNVRVLLTNFIQLFFNEKITIGPRSIIIDANDRLVNIEPEKFEYLQTIIGSIGGNSFLQTSKEPEFKPANKLAAEIAAKMQKGRQRIAAMQPQAKSEGFLAKYIRAVAIATSNSLAEINNMTMLQLNALMQTYINYEAYDLEIRSRLAGAKDEGKITHWIARPLEGEKESSVGKLEDIT